MRECSKSIARRLHQPNFINHYFVGDGLDIGGKPDPLSLYVELFCRMSSVRTWDWEDGDAQFLESVADGTYDFVHSSHCLEHLVDPFVGVKNWLRVLKPGGHLIITIPDEDLYEQGEFPSTFNRDHKWTFTIMKSNSWSNKSINVFDLIEHLGESADPQKVELLSATYRHSLPRYDQTLTPISESGIEVIIRRRTADELASNGRLPQNRSLSEEMTVHLNQYQDDLATLKRNNTDSPPFTNTKKI